jgi:hypothetical protein
MQGFNQAFRIKRCPWPDCDCVFRFRREGFFKQFQADTATIDSSIFLKVQTGKWMPGIGGTHLSQFFPATTLPEMRFHRVLQDIRGSETHPNSKTYKGKQR